MAGRRVLVAMKHVGLNVAADPFVNSALVETRRRAGARRRRRPRHAQLAERAGQPLLADFARIPCLEPANQQEAYDMTREAFELSERFHVPVDDPPRHASGPQPRPRGSRPGATPRTAARPRWTHLDWILLPAIARRLWQAPPGDPGRVFAKRTAAASANALTLRDHRRPGRHHHGHRAELLPREPSRAGPAAVAPAHRRVPDPGRTRCARSSSTWTASSSSRRATRTSSGSPRHPADGQARSWASSPARFRPTASSTPTLVREALGLQRRERLGIPGLELPVRPPQLCTGCPHGDTFDAIRQALDGVRELARHLGHRLLHARRAAALQRDRVLRLHGGLGRHGQGRGGRGGEARSSR